MPRSFAPPIELNFLPSEITGYFSVMARNAPRVFIIRQHHPPPDKSTALAGLVILKDKITPDDGVCHRHPE
jgi:hypothetical protein